MFTKHSIVSIISIITTVALLFSCSDESVVSTQMSETDSNAWIQKNGSEMAEANTSPQAARVYVYAITAEERIATCNSYFSIVDLDFPLSIQQVEMIEAGEIVEITDQDTVSFIVEASFSDKLHSREASITLVGILFSSKNIETDDWSCIKCCVAGIDYCCCDKSKDEGRWE